MPENPTNIHYTFPRNNELDSAQIRYCDKNIELINHQMSQSSNTQEVNKAHAEYFKAQTRLTDRQIALISAQTDFYKAQTRLTEEQMALSSAHAEYYRAKCELVRAQTAQEKKIQSKSDEFLRLDAEERRLQVKLMQVDAKEIKLPED